jgi:hypothetical protein
VTEYRAALFFQAPLSNLNLLNDWRFSPPFAAGGNIAADSHADAKKVAPPRKKRGRFRPWPTFSHPGDWRGRYYHAALKAPEAVLGRPLSPTAREILKRLLAWADEAGRLRLRLTRLAEEAGRLVSHLSRTLRHELEACGVIEVIRSSRNGVELRICYERVAGLTDGGRVRWLGGETGTGIVNIGDPDPAPEPAAETAPKPAETVAKTGGRIVNSNPPGLLTLRARVVIQPTNTNLRKAREDGGSTRQASVPTDQPCLEPCQGETNPPLDPDRSGQHPPRTPDPDLKSDPHRDQNPDHGAKQDQTPASEGGSVALNWVKTTARTLWSTAARLATGGQGARSGHDRHGPTCQPLSAADGRRSASNRHVPAEPPGKLTDPTGPGSPPPVDPWAEAARRSLQRRQGGAR